MYLVNAASKNSLLSHSDMYLVNAASKNRLLSHSDMYLVNAASKNRLLSHSDMYKTTCTLLFMALINVYYYKKGKKHYILNVFLSALK